MIYKVRLFDKYNNVIEEKFCEHNFKQLEKQYEKGMENSKNVHIIIPECLGVQYLTAYLVIDTYDE